MKTHRKKPRKSRFKSWTVLFSVCLFIYCFGVFIGPWLMKYIYGMNKIVQVIEENGIDAGAYYYTEIEGSYTGQQYLTQTLQLLAPEHYGLTLPLISGIVICLLILYFGLRALPQ
ncbi:DUF4179 domain-containing protein [Desulforhopalus singaporensis]|uniref:Uncharacterized protein n=1 Tax=Desulforhopalus singaporensis TaxID=91360 RepID=A0A1H0URR7_9BACT|nr:DUF4179 domain-containing protein [Desulforhopalus singaporensis]SDP68854.1 hypothetical protein SAMN05660330_03692 [Desulforhopalus singaporensis]